MNRDLRFGRYDVNEDDSDHGPGCNCLDCWLAHGKRFVDERGVPLTSDDEAHRPDCSCPECRQMENEVIVDRRGRPVDFKKEWKRERRKAALNRILDVLRRSRHH